MRTILICAAASLALAAGTVSAQPGGNGGGPGKGDKNDARGNRGPSPQQPQGPAKKPGNPGREDQAMPSMRGAMKDAAPGKPEKGPKGPDAFPGKPGKAEAPHLERIAGDRPGNGKPDKNRFDKGDGPGPAGKFDDRAIRHARQDDRRDDRGRDFAAIRPLRGDINRVSYDGPKGRKFFVPSNDRVRVVTDRHNFDWGAIDRRSAYTGCPPGLAKKYNGCTPPGLDRAPSHVWAQPDWYLSNYDRSYRYRYTDGYMLRLGSGTQVLGFIPLLGGALAVGQAWPGDYQGVTLPDYYDSYYDLGPADSYRYYDDTIYRVDPGNSTIQSIAALLTGNTFAIGKQMPAGYDVYNVPYDYRDQYVDGPDAAYRYSDGYIYQVDPTTQLIQAAIELLA